MKIDSKKNGYPSHQERICKITDSKKRNLYMKKERNTKENQPEEEIAGIKPTAPDLPETFF
jgi:hypothetical protein